MNVKSKKWQLQEAKNKFSELVRKATEEGPQIVTKHGKESVVVISSEEYRKLEKPETKLVDFFRQSPLKGLQIEIERDKSPTRKIQL